MLGEAVVHECPGVVARWSESAGSDASVLELIAHRDLTGLSTGRFSRPRVGVSWAKTAFSADVEFVGCAFTQFALPVTAGRDLDFDFRPAPGLRAPRAISPLLARSGGRFVLLAPIDHFHEQIVAVTDDGVTWGWHGDLDTVEAGFSTTLGIYGGDSVSEVLDRWAVDLTIDPDLGRVTDDPLSTHLSYWTDNGAAYWYRTEAGRTIADSVVDVVEHLRADDVPVHCVELDSWFYDHAVARPITEVGYPEEVPPTGMSTWTPRSDAFAPAPRSGHDAMSVQNSPPGRDELHQDALADLAERLGRPPLVLHARHISPDSPYVTDPDEWWVDELAAHPKDPAFFRRWFDDAARWGATCIEQDWMLMYWFGVGAMRAVPGRAARWQRAMNEHARATGVDLLWCMATPADLMLAASLDRVVAVRTCDDYRFAEDPALLWTWFLTVNRLANTLGLPTFKDCFFSNSDVDTSHDAIDGDEHAEFEALLSALSGGPVGIGDRIGRTERDIVMRTCDDDGRIRLVDRALAATDDCLFGGPANGDRLLWATTTATTDAGVWTYVVAVNTATDRRRIADRFELAGERIVYDWRSRRSATTNVVDVALDPRDWAMWVVSPDDVTAPAGVGDPTKYVVVEASGG